MLDKLDQKIISLLHQNARIAYKEVAAQVGLSAPAVTERIARLQERGIIRGYHAELDFLACGYPLEAVWLVRTHHQQLFAAIDLVKSLPEVVSCDTVTGENCLLVRLFATSVAHLDQLTYQVLAYGEVNTMIVKQHVVSPRLPPLQQP
ncbi:Lrp/AsnC family transcriptional regulator [Vitreoscilla massiliensis]|uniref:Lrp/AsnC family transcriptional regulator n=1 Tax=Vitreoscilla massiliensis TaxID=1689272 RepID=A0ABY4E639_9NEIS|nr:Lrp/AsnC family transcriptional regulator [Vitreoscilla massiliensis]UOO90763.1 Lrp/AsnC family transcriptional regulator [Vitreoscilla massiliensis]